MRRSKPGQPRKRIKNLDELFAYASKVIAKKETFRKIQFVGKDFSYTIKIDGDTWDGTVDVRHASYIIALQNSVNDLLSEFEVQGSLSEEDIRIKIDIQQGCSEIIPDLTKILISLGSKMTTTQIFISTILAIGGFVGIMALTRILNYRKELRLADKRAQELSVHEETKRALYQPMLDAFLLKKDRYSSYEKPVRILANVLDSDDEVTLSDGVSAIDQQEIKRNLIRATRNTKQVSYVDGEYYLERKDYSQGELIFTLSQGDITFRAYTTGLSTEDAESLAEEIASREINEELPFLLSLQLNVDHTKKKILSGLIVGVGQPRTDKEIKKLAALIG
ncbi:MULTISPECIES: hypothetical protein [unclassified Desulfovibrio]|uniref:hypothetical protein n=1 Tax=unclassified Desulfovibrio TaxID=2593640 RepID=UPI000F600C54|nr:MULTISPECIES: hypothetical protein [unclassified Desulfovibrio]RRD69003.1 hypothetical protein EII24_11735 [Desulfovibrio sp. OH1209_COT-279]RRD83526.1 hypothetical protein EII23_11735 [Desulfovibrio sp. OH1186_COT-070]